MILLTNISLSLQQIRMHVSRKYWISKKKKEIRLYEGIFVIIKPPRVNF